ncbi:MAG: MFS transporter, partial [Candidatus Eremiobacteraeota bacterium]|nr:MFS transporter [Candidatus Eremiobacteraeota bacterium]
VSAPLFSMIPSFKSEKTVIQISLVIFLLGNWLTAVSTSLGLFLIGRVVTGIGAGVFTPSCIAITMKFTDPEKKGRALSFILGANSAGVVFGIPLGLQLANRYSWQLPLYYIIVLSLVALIGVSLQKLDVEASGAGSAFLERFRLLGDRDVLAVIGVTCFTSMACIGLHSYIAALQDGTPNSLTAILFFWGLGGFFGSSFIGYFVDRTRRPQWIMTLILTGLVATFFFLPQARSLQYLGVVPFFLWGVLGWATTTPQQHTLFKLNEEQGRLLTALNSSALGLGGALGTAAGGWLIAYGVKTESLPLWTAGLLLGVLVFQVLFVNRIDSKNDVRTERA